ncbi:primosomal protein [bacterium]|nr:primosomal protein [bacterium]|tara:strand:+ start:53 stop:658 length:606 start_codon:yes stop_codon:yes gene_type:complete
MSTLLTETHIFKANPVFLAEGKTSERGLPLVEGILATAEIKNGNGRYYSRELWDREINKYLPLVKEHRAMGELDHPESSVINLKNVSHNIADMWWDGDNVIGKIEILPTPSGNILKALIESNITVGVSSRGMGSLKDVGGLMEVQDDFELLCWDFVSTPSNPDSFMHLVSEGLDFSKQTNYQKVNSIISEILCSNGQCPII